MTIRRRLARSNLVMILIPVAIAAVLLPLGGGLALLLLERVWLPRLGLSFAALHETGEQLETAFAGAKALAAIYAGTVILALTGAFDLLLLDLMLPGVDGFTILMVSARTGDADKIRGLGFGADDYIEKPFSPSVLVARVKAHLAQVKRLQPSPAEPAVLTVGPLTAKLDARQIFKNGVGLPLKNREYELLLFLMRHPGQVFSREDLYEMIWGLESMGDNITVAVHIGRIREKLEDDPASPKLLQTVWGVGYRLRTDAV